MTLSRSYLGETAPTPFGSRRVATVTPHREGKMELNGPSPGASAPMDRPVATLATADATGETRGARFARRAPFGTALDASLVYLRDHRGALAAVLALANLLSVLDLGFTSIALRLGAVEANPFMRYFFEASTTQAAVVKCGLVFVASLGTVSYTHLTLPTNREV